jgi:hypothetical protein
MPPTSTPIVTVVSSSALRNQVKPGDTPPAPKGRDNVRYPNLILLVLLAAAVAIAALLTRAIGPP